MTKPTQDQQLDAILDEMDNLIGQCRFAEIDTILAALNVNAMSLQNMLAYLTTTLVAKDHLTERKNFFLRARDKLVDDVDDMLVALW